MESTQLRRKLQVPTKRLLIEDDTETSSSTESPLVVDCSLEWSNDAPLCSFPTSYGLCEYRTQNDLDKVSAATSASDISNLQQLFVAFDYEIHYETKSGEVPVDFVKGYLMQHLAQAMGLSDCLEGSSEIALESPGTSTSLMELSILGMSTGLPDQLDMQDSCSSPIDKSIQQADCHRVEGQVLLFVAPSDDWDDDVELLVRSKVLKEIRSIMQDDKLVWSTGPSINDGSVHQVVFMGQRREIPDDSFNQGGAPTLPDSRNATTNEPKERPWTTVGVVFVALFGFALALSLLAMWKLRRAHAKTNTTDDKEGTKVSNVDESDAEEVAGAIVSTEIFRAQAVDAKAYTNIETPLSTDEEDSFPTHEISVPSRSDDDEDDKDDGLPIEIAESVPETFQDDPAHNEIIASTKALETLSEPAPVSSWGDDDDETASVGMFT